ncbi:helix-turn-helix domain-containing protein [Desulfosporosinus sp. PR]|uniref:helix-turn-helix domain-containing protein n=1 Tax=Candidatus Desulfosporosinus nitrosoreducens TaxID=3401928 RepID=UPI0027F5B0FC|nr:helix-turn-helix domain-containing protein [Desulfosporosinus sp. PR]MDQ7095984.1 helix-turn-helix domain-containing protein [Desulfosporosinus sp. PR]
MEEVKFASLDEILTAQDIANYLKISRGTVYGFLKRRPEHGGIPNIAIGITKRVEKKDFAKWLEAQKGKAS